MKKLAIIFKLLKKQYPGKKFFADAHTSPYKVLISTILSQRTKDINTLKAAKQLFDLADTPKEILKLKPSKIEKAIKPAGFYRNKTKTILKVTKQILESYKGKVPKELDDLLKLQGVGRKTANCVLVFGFRLPGIPIDVHLHKITNRLGWVDTKTPDETEMELRKILPKKYWLDINELFVRHGQTICFSRNPRCQICPINNYCNHYHEVFLKTKHMHS
ncbi:MAG: endonuclease III [Nanoarchaeota archaeon]|nr:endonuclease III [Nanoarchaeota archaeon]